MSRLATRPLDDSPRDLQQRAHTNASSSFALRHLPLLMSNLWQSSLYAHHTVSAPGHSSPLSCPSPSGSRTQQEPRRVSVAPSELENREKKALNQNQLNKTRMHSSRMPLADLGGGGGAPGARPPCAWHPSFWWYFGTYCIK